jgi:hypothetical protein
MAEQPFLYEPDGSPWIEIRDGDNTARELFKRHYSRYVYADGRDPKLFVGPGRKMVLMTADARALFVWREFRSADHQEGVNCAIFRNESVKLSSELIRDADAAADELWGKKRHYTYVNPRKIRSTNPGCCFLKAGWRKCGYTKKRHYLILERPA